MGDPEKEHGDDRYDHQASDQAEHLVSPFMLPGCNMEYGQQDDKLDKQRQDAQKEHERTH